MALQYNETNLILIRHAKSSWKEPYDEDFNRVLNSRGLRDAPIMGGWLDENFLKTFEGTIKPLISSSQRTRMTWEKLSEGIRRSMLTKFQAPDFEDSLYHPTAETILRYINDNRNKNTLIIVHNPGITEFLNQFCNENFLNFPTCAIALIRFKKEGTLQYGDGELLKFQTPKELINS